MSTYLLAFIAIFVELCYIDTNIVYVERVFMGVDTVKSRVCHCCGNIFENNGKCPQCGADAYQKPDSDTVKKGSSLFFKYMGGRGFAAKSFLSRAARLENINALITLGDNYFKK